MQATVSLATALNPYIGYAKAAEIAKEAVATGRSIIEIAREKKLLSEDQIKEILDPARMTYACRNVLTRYRLVEMDTNTPCPMRAPGVVTGGFALEAAMDELAVALGMDPLELRLENHAERNEQDDLPWSSKAQSNP